MDVEAEELSCYVVGGGGKQWGFRFAIKTVYNIFQTKRLDQMAMAVREQLKVLKDKTYLLRDVGVLSDISSERTDKSLEGQDLSPSRCRGPERHKQPSGWILSRLPSAIHQHCPDEMTTTVNHGQPGCWWSTMF